MARPSSSHITGSSKDPPVPRRGHSLPLLSSASSASTSSSQQRLLSSIPSQTSSTLRSASFHTISLHTSSIHTSSSSADSTDATLTDPPHTEAYAAYLASQPSLLVHEAAEAAASRARIEQHEAAVAARREKNLQLAINRAVAAVKAEQEVAAFREAQEAAAAAKEAAAADALAAQQAAAATAGGEELVVPKLDLRNYTKHPVTAGEKAGRRVLPVKKTAPAERKEQKWRMRRTFLIAVPVAVVCVLIATITPAVYFTLRKQRLDAAAVVTATATVMASSAPVVTSVPETPVSADDSGFELTTGSWLVFARRTVGAPGVVNRHARCGENMHFDLYVRYEEERRKYAAELRSQGLGWKDMNCPPGGKGVASVGWVQDVRGCEPAEYVTVRMDTRDLTVTLDHEWKVPDRCDGAIAQGVGAETFRCNWKARYEPGAPDNMYTPSTS